MEKRRLKREERESEIEEWKRGYQEQIAVVVCWSAARKCREIKRNMREKGVGGSEEKVETTAERMSKGEMRLVTECEEVEIKNKKKRCSPCCCRAGLRSNREFPRKAKKKPHVNWQISCQVPV